MVDAGDVRRRVYRPAWHAPAGPFTTAESVGQARNATTTSSNAHLIAASTRYRANILTSGTGPFGFLGSWSALTRNRTMQPRLALGTRLNAVPDETGLGTLPTPRRPMTKSGLPQFAAVFQDKPAHLTVECAHEPPCSLPRRIEPAAEPAGLSVSAGEFHFEGKRHETT